MYIYVCNTYTDYANIEDNNNYAANDDDDDDYVDDVDTIISNWAFARRLSITGRYSPGIVVRETTTTSQVLINSIILCVIEYTHFMFVYRQQLVFSVSNLLCVLLQYKQMANMCTYYVL